MVDILIKDTLRQSVEASSGGKQTIRYTAKGQPSFMNVVEVFENSLYGSADGMGAIHPAFYYDNQVFSRLFIGTYQGVIKNGELVSQPYKDIGTGMQYSLRDVLTAARACGRGFHQMTYKEHCAVMYSGLAKGGLALGNTNRGADQTGHKGVLAGQFTLTGSGGYTWSHDGSLYGIQDLSGNGWQFVAGLRIKGDELQIQGNNRSYNYDTADQHFAEDWWAIDANTGALIPSTETGTVNTTDFRITTPNSVRVSNNVDNVGTNAIAFPAWNPNILGNYRFGTNITEACKAQLKTFGVIPVSTVVTNSTALFNIFNDNPYTTTYFVRCGAPDTGDASGIRASASIVNSDAPTISSNFARPCYIEI